MSRFDLLDREIIKYLNRDGRASCAQIGRALDVSERTVHNRIRRLEEKNIIKPIVVVNPIAFGFTIAVDIFCEVEVGYQDLATQAILNMPEVSYVAISTGDQDISLQALFKNIEEIHSFITDKLHQIPGMRRTKTVLLPKILKDSFHWLPPDNADLHIDLTHP